MRRTAALIVGRAPAGASAAIVKSARHGQSIEVSITIHRPVADVFSFYRDLRHLPLFLGDVVRVDRMDLSTYRWTIAGPLATRTRWRVRVIDERPGELLRYETVTSRWQTCWEVHFSPGSNTGETQVREVMQMSVGWLGRMALAMIGKFPSSEMRANLNRLKQLMETGRVTDQSFAVPGRFSDRSPPGQVQPRDRY